MLPARNLLTLSAVLAACLGVFGCAAKPPSSGGTGKTEKAPPKGSPEAAFAKAQGALRARDFGVIHDMLSESARARVEAEVAKTASSAAAMGSLAPALLGFDPVELKALSAREKYVKVMTAAYETNARLGSALRPGDRPAGLAGAEVAGAKVDGDRATVTVNLPGGATRVITLVREGDAWKLAEPLSARVEASDPAKKKPKATEASPGARKKPSDF